MSSKLFIPVTDEMLYEHPERITAPLRPYQVDNPTLHWMAVIEESMTKKPDSKTQNRLGQSNYRSWLKSKNKSYTRLSRA
ncbi:MAG: hypothetical protein OXE41_01620 [Gammaproteobacteria bacterium]|nr:hypothetical protein [Gammaproteobacteria bacterium]MCY4217997.1 hypothetical protein [Gammaproteobacteria bacterium]MCY4274087.1 hypothetical protein [Gammaproteobacteria bacterium]